MEEEKVLIDVEIKATEALKELAELKIKAEQLRAEQKNLDTSTKQGREAYEALGEQIKAVNKEANERSKVIQNEIKQQNQQKDSLNQMGAHMSALKKQYRDLSAEQRNSQFGKDMLAEIAALNQELKDAEQAYGVYTRDVGNYEKATKSLRGEMRDLTEQLAQMLVNGEKNSEAYRQMAERLAQLKDATADVTQETKNMASDTSKLDMISDSVTTLTALYGAYASVVGITTDASDEFQEVMKKLQVAAVALAAATKIQNALQKQSNVYRLASNLLQAIGINQTEREAKAIAAKTAMQNASTKATKAAAAVQWLWNAALAANPVVLITIAIAALIVGIGALIKILGSSSDAEKDAAKASEAYEEQVKKTAKAVEDSTARQNDAISKRKQALNEEVLALMKSGATEEEIAKAKAKAEEDMRKVQLEESQKRQQAYEAESKKLDANIAAQKRLLASREEGSKKYKKESAALDELIKKRADLNASINSEIEARQGLLLQQAEDAKKQADAEAKAQGEAAKKRKEAYEKRQSDAAKAALKEIEQQDKINDEHAKQQEALMAQDYATQTAWALKEFERKEASEKKKLDIQRKYGQLSEADYQSQLALLDAKRDTFNQGQLAKAKKFYEDTIAAAKQLLGESQDQELAATEDKYDNQLALIQEANQQLAAEYEELRVKQQSSITAGDAWMDTSKMMTQEEIARLKEVERVLMENAATELALEDKKQKDLQAIKKKYADKRSSEIADENTFNILKMQNADATEDAIYQLQLEGLKARMGLYDEDSREYQQLLSEKLKLEKDYQKKQQETIEETYQKAVATSQRVVGDMQKAMEVVTTISDTIKEQEDAAFDTYKEQQESRKKALEKRLDSGLLTQEQYEKGVQDLDAETERKQKELSLKQAKRQKAMAIMNATLNAAAAIIASLAASPVAIGIVPNPAGIASLALATATGAAQVAAAIATPLPKAAKGGIAGGGLLVGNSHAQGGIPIEAEGGEAIINKRSTAKYRGLLSAINADGGGARFAQGGIVGAPIATAAIPDGGYTTRQAAASVSIDNVQDIANALSQLKIYTAITDINRGQAQYAQIVQNSKI